MVGEEREVKEEEEEKVVESWRVKDQIHEIGMSSSHSLPLINFLCLTTPPSLSPTKPDQQWEEVDKRGKETENQHEWWREKALELQRRESKSIR